VNIDKIAVICDSEDYDSQYILQLITKARSLADYDNSKVLVCCVGPYHKEKLQNLSRFGADTIIICERPNVTDVWMYSDIISEMLREHMPDMAIFPASDFGKEIAAIISTVFEAGLTADCIDIKRNKNNEVSFYRAALNDSVIAEIQCKDSAIRLCTVKKGIFVESILEDRERCNIERFPYEITYNNKNPVQILESKKISNNKIVDINKYEIVFCVGRGVKKVSTYKRIEDLSKRFGAVVAGTRVAVEEGFINKEYQIGQSGKSVSPKIYVGFGISGASQHIVGIINSGIIVAINKEENAPIFQYADCSIVADIDDILDEIEKII